jgi:hypothetical protein
MSNCIECQSLLSGKYQKKFCGKSCAASFNNKANPKRKSHKQKCKTLECSEMLIISKGRSYCSTCIKADKHLRGKSRNISTIEEMVKRSGSNGYDQIRTHAHWLYRDEKKISKCENCKYAKHVELCHIRPISSFPKETKLEVVNAKDNVLFLCPNCHWELDHGFLTLQETKSAPGEI